MGRGFLVASSRAVLCFGVPFDIPELLLRCRIEPIEQLLFHACCTMLRDRLCLDKALTLMSQQMAAKFLKLSDRVLNTDAILSIHKWGKDAVQVRFIGTDRPRIFSGMDAKKIVRLTRAAAK